MKSTPYIVSGRVVWWLAVRRIPVLEAFRIPALATGAIVLGTLAWALLTGVVVAALAMGSSVARALRSE